MTSIRHEVLKPPIPTTLLFPKMLTILIVSILTTLTQLVAAWGAGTHPTIASLADRYLLKETVMSCCPPSLISQKDRIDAILANDQEYNGSLGSVANWADQTRTTLTEPWHFIDAEDSLTPPENVTYLI